MTFPRKISLLLFTIVLLAALGHWNGLALPSLRWFFTFELSAAENLTGWANFFNHIIGWSLLSVLIVSAVLLWLGGAKFEWNPMTLRRLKRFRSLKRGYRSFLLVMALLLITVPDQALVGRKALAVKYEGQWFFPAFVTKNYSADLFGGDQSTTANYRELKKSFSLETDGNFVIMPLIPWDTTFDTDELQKISLVNREGIYYEDGSQKPYQGLATAYYPNNPELQQREATFRKGKLQGRTTLYNSSGDPIGTEQWTDGKKESEIFSEGSDATTATPVSDDYFALKYPPTAPSWSQRHILGTDSRGWDLFAQLYGGLQVVCKASFLYVLLTFAIGISMGLISGYFGGLFDLILQRLIEIINNIPFLFVVMIIASRIGRESVSILTIIAVMCLFSWIGVSIYKRTAALKERERDYVAAARVLGADTPRIIFRHILPNVLATTITLIPFSVTAVATSLTALDFIGFGLPDRYPSWGTLLADGLANLEAPWIVSSVFVVLVTLLLLITFVGEAIREAFDPKKFTTYH